MEQISTFHSVSIIELAAPCAEETIRRLSLLHTAELENSAISALGLSGAMAFYRFATKSRFETVLVAQIDNRICGGAVFTRKPGTLAMRFMLDALCRGNIKIIFRSMHHLLYPGTSASSGESNVTGIPARIVDDGEITSELSLIFVDRAIRGLGAGLSLLVALEDNLRAAGQITHYFTRTSARSDNAAIGFYDRVGFERVGRTRSERKPLLVLRRKIDNKL